MKVLIVAKTKLGKGACIGAMTQDGSSLRLVEEGEETHLGAGHEFEIGDVWEIDALFPEKLRPPHVEDVVVRQKRRVGIVKDVSMIIVDRMPVLEGPPEGLYDGCTRVTGMGSMYVSERSGLPGFSTQIWRIDREILKMVVDGKVYYSFTASDGSTRRLSYVGFAPAEDRLPRGTLLRISLARWWRPADAEEMENRCYVQLSGWC